MTNYQMRIAIVNDTSIAVEALRRVVVKVPDYEIAWIARDGAEAVAKCAADTPDLILMDLLMPIMDGVEATRRIMTTSPCAILVVTSTVSGNASKVFEAMGYGALDAINTPMLGTGGHTEGGAGLLSKIATIGKLIGKPARNRKLQIPKPKSLVPALVAIGSSTGGPKALAAVLSQFSRSFQAAVVIVQHVDAQFAPGLVDWLNEQTALPVELAMAGCPVEGGKVLVAGTNDHLVLQSNLTLTYTEEPRDYPYRPSVDVFFSSIADCWPGKGIGVLLTGMGRDGAQGLMSLRSASWHTIAQDRATSVVYGMPKAAAELGAAVQILPIQAIGSILIEKLGK
jgi:two-component system response regulator WspF